MIYVGYVVQVYLYGWEMPTKIYSEIMKGKENLGDQGVNGRK